MSFGFGVRVMRAARNMSQIELAIKAGVNRDYLQKAERGDMVLNDQAQSRIRIALTWPEAIDPLLERIQTAHYEA